MTGSYDYPGLEGNPSAYPTSVVPAGPGTAPLYPAKENPPVGSQLDRIEAKVDRLTEILEPLVPVIAAAPSVLEEVQPFMNVLKNSPVMKMMGLRL